MEATTFLSNDHRKVEQLFRDYQSATTPEMKKMCVDKMVAELSIHSRVEEMKFYPFVRENVAEAIELVDQSLEEHQNVKGLLTELERMDPEEEEEYDSKVQTLMTDVKHHVQEEEHELFPKVRAECSVQELQHLGQELEEAKAAASTHPQPDRVVREHVRAEREESRQAER